MVQNLQIINKAVVSLHPTVPNPYAILGEIPPSAKWFSLGSQRCIFFAYHWVKNLPAMRETWVQSLVQKDPLERGMATLSSILT